MRAVVLTEAGSAPTVAQLEVPEPGDGEVRVKVHAASINGFDRAGICSSVSVTAVFTRH